MHNRNLSDSGPTAALRQTFASIGHGGTLPSHEEKTRLHSEVCAFVDDLKVVGKLPEQVVVLVRQMARETSFDDCGDVLLQEIATWCIEHYFQAPSARPPTS